MNKTIILGFLAILFSACTHGTFYVPNEKSVYEPTVPESIAITPQKKIDRKHVVIGKVAVITWGSGEDARRELQKQAAKVGANAILGIELQKGFLRTAANGTAVLIFQ